MTTPRMTDERLAGARKFAEVLRHGRHTIAAGVLDEVCNEITRTRTVSDEVRAAAKVYRLPIIKLDGSNLVDPDWLGDHFNAGNTLIEFALSIIDGPQPGKDGE